MRLKGVLCTKKKDHYTKTCANAQQKGGTHVRILGIFGEARCIVMPTVKLKIGASRMNLGKWEVLFWMPPSAWCLNWGYYPSARDPAFFFVNIGAIEIRHFGAYNKKKVCKRCGQEMPASNGGDK